jgi:hypothetical protein
MGYLIFGKNVGRVGFGIVEVEVKFVIADVK